MSVYDNQKTESEAEQLRRITGISPGEERAMEARAGSPEAPAGIKGSQATNTYDPDTNAPSASGLLKAESNPTTDLGGSGVSSEDVSPSFLNRTRTALKKKRNRFIIGGAGAVGGLGIAGFLVMGSVFPVLRINNLVETFQDHFYASSEDAADKSTDLLLRTYIVKKVMPGMVTHRCSSTKVSMSCAAPSDATTPVGALFATWKDARLENKLYQRYGIEIIRQGKGNNSFYFRSNTLQHEIFLGEYTPNNTREFNNRVFAQLSRNDIRKEMRRALQDETLYKRMKYRFLVGPLLEHKYNIRRCILACATRDRAHDTIDAKKQAFSSWLNERVVGPRSEMYSLVIDCALSNFDCTNGDEIDKNGEHTSKFERDVQTRLAEFRLRYGEEDLNKLFEDSRDFREKGAVDFMISKLLARTGTQLSLRVADITNPIGWIDLGAHLIVGAKNAGPALTKMSTVLYSQTAVATYMMYRSTADELKAGKADVTEIGSFSDALDANPQNDQGGMAGEDSPVYDAINGSGKNTLAAALLPQASAAESVGPYKCNDNEPLDGSSLACDEEKAGNTNWIGDGASYGSAFLRSPLLQGGQLPLEAWVKVSDFLTGLIAKGINFLTDGIKLIPGVGDFYKWAEDHITELAQSVMATVIEYVIPSPLTDHTSGARLVQVAAAGADFSANDFTHYGMGGRVLTDAEVASIRSDQEAQQAADFNRTSYFARMFSTASPRSFISQVASSTPHSFTEFSTSVASAFSNPLRTLGNSFAALLPGNHAEAAVISNPFGITQYGWTDEDVQAVGFADDYWNANCKDLTAFNTAWGEAAVENDDTGMFDNKTTNPCLFLESGVSMSGGIYNDKLLQTSYTAAPDQVTSTTAPATGTGPVDQKTLYQDSTSVACAPGTTNLGIQDGYHDGILVKIRVCAIPGFPSTSSESRQDNSFSIKGAGGMTIVNSRVSANFLALVQAAKKDGVSMSSVSGFRSMAHQQALCPCDGILAARPGYSNHQMGIAVDFSEPDTKNSAAQSCTTRVRDTSSAQWKWLNDNAAQFGIRQYSAESWHWDAMVAANRCGGDGS